MSAMSGVPMRAISSGRTVRPVPPPAAGGAGIRCCRPRVVHPRGHALAPLLGDLGPHRTGGLGPRARTRGARCTCLQACTHGPAGHVLARTVWHGNEPALNTAVRAAHWRATGDTGVLDRKGSADISPLVAVALAAWDIPTGGLEPFLIVT
jgi:hypothetical protein